MFCSYCGKQIAQGSRFCSFCGSAVVGAGRNAGAIQPEAERREYVQPVQTVEPVQTVQPVENPVPIELTDEPDSEIAEPADEAVNAVDEPIAPTLDEQQISLDITTRIPDFPEQSSDFQQQEQLPEPQMQTQEQQAAFNAPQTQISEQQNTFSTMQNAGQNYPIQQDNFNQPVNAPERKYTAAHLIMCLASTAVFAIAAGVFAGLYFAGV